LSNEDENIVRKGESKNARLGDLAVRIENQTEIDKDEWWNETRRWIEHKYQEKGVPFDVNTIQTKAELEQHLAILKRLEGRDEAERQASIPPAPRGGTTAPLNDSQITGQKPETERLPLDRVISEVPLTWLEFDSEEELVATLKKISEDRTDSRSELARKAYNQLTKKVIGKSQTWELQGNMTNLDKNKKKPLPYFEKVKEESE
jgi:hypothetical protein